MSPRIVIVAFLAAVAAGALLAWLAPLPEPEARQQLADPGPGPADVSALIEEARRITGEAAAG